MKKRKSEPVQNLSDLFYLYDLQNKSFVSFESKHELLLYLSHWQHKSSRHPYYYGNTILDCLSMTQTDVTVSYPFSWDVGYRRNETYRIYRVLDGLGRTVDIREWYSTVEHLWGLNKANSVYYWGNPSIRWRLRNCTLNPRYRIDPIPFIRSRKRHRGSTMRRPKTTSERRANAAPEISEYVRPSRKPNTLINAWDDIFRDTQKSWKRNTNKRKQWS